MIKKTKKIFLLLLYFVINPAFAQTTIEQKLVVVLNEGTLGGDFQVAIQVKGTNLTAANTLGSATIDVQFDNTMLTYIDATLGPITFALGYANSTPVDNITFIRYGPLGSAVGPGEGTGYDLTSVFDTWVTLNFTINNPAGTTDLTINNSSNQIGLFDSHSNSNNSGIIINQSLTTPINIFGEPLPVELNSFTAQLINSVVKLIWTTETEVNNYGFEIQRLKGNTTNWSKIGFVEGHGNSNSPNEYYYLDNTVESGIYSYRLKQLDNNGDFSYSGMIEIDLGLPDKYDLSQNYPNPFNPETLIKFSLPEAGQVQLKVYNTLGEEIQTLINENMEAGIHRVTFIPDNLISGIYIYQLETNGFVDSKKMIYLK